MYALMQISRALEASIFRRFKKIRLMCPKSINIFVEIPIIYLSV